ncbi:MAG: histidine kinase dimerization/phospho-acceptor domain-containing protein, partial [bacterium]
MLEIYTWSVLITGIFFTSFGVFVYLKNKKDLSNKLFGLLSLAFAVWCYAWFALLLVKSNQEMAIFWAKFLNLGAIFIPIFYLHWVLSVLNLHKRKKYLLALGYIIIFLFAINSFSSSYIKGVHSMFFFPFWPTAGPLYKWFLIFGYFGMVGYAFLKLIREIGKQEGEKKYQIGYIIIGSLLGFGGGATNFPLMYKFEILQPIIGMVAVMASPFILGYAAMKYKLMNIKVIATELFGGVIALVLLINFLTSETTEEWFIRGFVLILGLIFSVLFIRSVLKEVRAREEIERLAKELEKANIRLKELDQAKSEFVTITSHQLRAPITAIKGYSSMLMEGTFGPVPEKAKTAVDRIFQSSDRLVRLIADFLNLSRIERGKMEYDFQKFDLKDLVKSIFDDFFQINGKRKI